MRKTFIFSVVLLTLFTVHYSLFTREALAICPVCTVAVGAGLGLSRYLGIDDMVSGIWVGGLIVSMTLWAIDWSEKKYKLKSRFKYLGIAVFAAVSALTILPLSWAGIIGHPFNTVFGIDKLIFGSVFGIAAFYLGFWADKKVRSIKGRQLFSYQKVVFPVTSLLIFSLVLYFFGGHLLK